jgi:lysozyme family protein
MINLIIDIILRAIDQEGGYVNDPNDSGGETNFGISKRAYPSLDIKNLTKEDAVQLYYKDYWLMYHCADVFRCCQPLADKYFNCLILTGPTQAMQILQRSIRCVSPSRQLIDDGFWGEKTFNALLEWSENQRESGAEIISSFKSEWAGVLRYISVVKPKNQKFLQGWLNRAYS